jgi:Domain of unknown function (DUF4326)
MTANVDKEWSIRIAQRVRARFRRCWDNAARAVHHLGDGARYVEGWIVVHRGDPLVVEHGWCEVDGRIVDPTYTTYVSTLEPPLAYFPGQRFSPAETYRAQRQAAFPIALHDDPPEYHRAFEAALRHARGMLPQEPLPPTRVVNCRQEPCDLFVGRPSKWANPFHLGRQATPEQVVEKFRRWFIRQPSLLREVQTLRGKVLGCDCAPEPCHGDVLAEFADFAR